MRALLLLFASMLLACATDADPALDSATAAQDDQAQGAPAVATGLADGSAPFVGIYVTHATTHRDGDITALQLFAGDTSRPYVRDRCYHASCALPLPETDHYDVYTSSAGKTYVRFWSVQNTLDASGSLITQPIIADVYEIQPTSSGVRLRKSYTTRWFTLYRTSARARCAATGGNFSNNDCACATPGQFFAPGAGGCIAHPGWSESNCDASVGSWTDDEETLIGGFCVCGYERYADESGRCTDV